MKYDPECEVPSCYLVSDDDATFAQEKSLHEIQVLLLTSIFLLIFWNFLIKVGMINLSRHSLNMKI
jgi:hypothetical protein